MLVTNLSSLLQPSPLSKCLSYPSWALTLPTWLLFFMNTLLTLLRPCSMPDWPPTWFPSCPSRLLYPTLGRLSVWMPSSPCCALTPNAKPAPTWIPPFPTCASTPYCRPRLHTFTLIPLLWHPTLDNLLNPLWLWPSAPAAPPCPSQFLGSVTPNQITSTHAHLSHYIRVPTPQRQATPATWMSALSHTSPDTLFRPTGLSFPPGRDAYHALCFAVGLNCLGRKEEEELLCLILELFIVFIFGFLPFLHISLLAFE